MYYPEINNIISLLLLEIAGNKDTFQISFF